MAGMWVVEVSYEMPASTIENTFGTFRSQRAADRFAAEVRAWAAARDEADRAEVHVTTRVFPVTRPLLDFVQEDVARHSEVEIIT